jgi:hypothetical protein
MALVDGLCSSDCRDCEDSIEEFEFDSEEGQGEWEAMEGGGELDVGGLAGLENLQIACDSPSKQGLCDSPSKKGSALQYNTAHIRRPVCGP